MIDVILAEDEWAARENIKLLVGKYPRFRIVAEAENGDEACEKATQLQPDLLLTDIKMPGKNGIELLQILKNNCPCMETVIISAYSNFNYAKEALKVGSLDYLLKPINLNQFNEMMGRLEQLIGDKQIKERSRIFSNMILDEPVDSCRLKKYFTFPSYHLALVRELGLPDRNSIHHSSEGTTEITSGLWEISCVYGRDAQEALYLWPKGQLNTELFEEKHIKQLRNKDGYYTILDYQTGLSVEDIPRKIYKMYQTLHNRLILGKSQIIHMDKINAEEPDYKTDVFNIHLLTHLIKSGKWAALDGEVRATLKRLEQADYPLYIVMRCLDFLLMNLAKQFSRYIDFPLEMGEVYCCAKNMDELIVSVLDVMRRQLKQDEANLKKIDTEEFYDQVIRYVQDNFDKPMTLSMLGEAFHVSPSYMSRLFKKYANLPFNDYLTRCRLDKACRLFKENPKLLIKDVATLVGISDQFYFSRLFRSVIGKTPTQYCESLIK